MTDSNSSASVESSESIDKTFDDEIENALKEYIRLIGESYKHGTRSDKIVEYSYYFNSVMSKANSSTSKSLAS